MRIAIVGAGKVGATLARAWVEAGHEVVMTFSRDAAGLDVVARDVGARAAVPTEAASGADLVLLAVPAAAIETALGEVRLHPGQTLIDATNDLGEGRSDNGARRVAELVPRAHVVKAFNTVFAEEMAAARSRDEPPDLLLAGDDAGAIRTAEAAIRDAGFRPVLAGGLEVAGDVEAFARLVIGLAYREKRGPFVYRLSIPA